MKYNPKIHHRHSIRLKGYDYSQSGAYYITICCHDRKHFFGKVENGIMSLNAFGRIAHEEWERLPERFANIELDEFQIMPNHMHGIIVIKDVGASLADAPVSGGPAVRSNETVSNCTEENVKNASKDDITADIPDVKKITVGDMIGAYKSIVANKCLELWKSKRPQERMGKLWQRNFYEHIIRDEQSLNNIREYIINNPGDWGNRCRERRERAGVNPAPTK
jgi:REP element-mobilizing transposase RayT